MTDNSMIPSYIRTVLHLLLGYANDGNELD